LRLGYRHVDTAQVYGNEHEVGEAIRSSGLGREKVFVTTKLWNADQGYDSALRAFDASLERLGFDYVDRRMSAAVYRAGPDRGERSKVAG
jgi:2,5-diketo-D-gluconate reductase A